ncbi:MAG: type I-E CRISPR-associated protein Cas7/Cse4/CasC [Ruminococcus bicirculans (ex Wegman et al. 2014)]
MQNEYDYFTVLMTFRTMTTQVQDILNSRVHSSTLYRYANVNVTELQRHLQFV